MVFTDEAFVEMLTLNDPRRVFRVTTDLPPDASLVGTYYFPERQGWMMVFEHPSFDEVPPGCQLPLLGAATIELITLVEEE
jgi:hypothetical protein